jgi:hypothetical protein
VHETSGRMGGAERGGSCLRVLCLVWCDDAILRSNISHAHSPTHNDHIHIHASAPSHIIPCGSQTMRNLIVHLRVHAHSLPLHPQH